MINQLNKHPDSNEHVEPYPLDATDRALIGALNRNGRASLRELAAELDVALGTVSTRLRRLEEAHVITGFVPEVDAERAGFPLVAIIGLRIAKGKLMEVQAKVAQDPAVYGVYDVTGDWDSIVLVRFRDRYQMDDFIKHTQAFRHVERSYTQLVLNTVKEECRVIL